MRNQPDKDKAKFTASINQKRIKFRGKKQFQNQNISKHFQIELESNKLQIQINQTRFRGLMPFLIMEPFLQPYTPSYQRVRPTKFFPLRFTELQPTTFAISEKPVRQAIDQRQRRFHFHCDKNKRNFFLPITALHPVVFYMVERWAEMLNRLTYQQDTSIIMERHPESTRSSIRARRKTPTESQ